MTSVRAIDGTKRKGGMERLMQIPKGLKKAWDVISTAVVVIVVIFAILLVGVRLFGIQVFAVISGSMEPDYPVGSLIYVKDADPGEIKVGDVITYVLPDDTPSTHRVIEVDAENRCFYTKGDANKIEDGPPVHFENLIGKPVFTIPLLGYVAHYIQHPPGMYVALAAGAILLILVFLPDLFGSGGKKTADTEKTAEVAGGPKPKTEDSELSGQCPSDDGGNQSEG